MSLCAHWYPGSLKHIEWHFPRQDTVMLKQSLLGPHPRSADQALLASEKNRLTCKTQLLVLPTS